MPTKMLENSETNDLLSSIGLEVGQWGQLKPQESAVDENFLSLDISRYNEKSVELYSEILDNIDMGEWQIYKFDFSSSLNFDEKNSLFGGIFGIKNWNEIYEYSSIFSYGNYNMESIRIASRYIAQCIDGEQHSHFVTSGFPNSCRLSIQDGFLIAISSRQSFLTRVAELGQRVLTDMR